MAQLSTRVLTPIVSTYAAMFVVCISSSALSTIFPPFAQARVSDVATIGFLVAIYSVLSLVSRLPAGALCGMGAGRAAAIGSIVMMAVTYAAYPLAGDTLGLTGVRALNGLAYGVFNTVNMAQLMEAIERPERRAVITAWYLGWMAAGHAVGGFVSGFLADALGFELSFLACSALTLVALPFLAIGPRLGHPAAIAAAPRARSGGHEWSVLLSLPLLVAALQGFAVNAMSQIMWTFYLLYGLEVGITLSLLGLHRGAYSTTSMITRPLVGTIARYVSYNTLATWGLVLTAAMTLAVPLLTTFWPLLLVNVVLGGLRAAALVGSMVAAVEYAGTDPRKRGTAAGVYSFASDAANVTAPLAGGILADRIGLGATFWAMALGLIAVYLGLLAVSAAVARRRADACVTHPE